MASYEAKFVDDEVEEVFRDESASFNLSSKYFQKAPKQTLAFVNLTGSSGPTQDGDKRKFVRAHVMRRFQKQKQVREQEEFDEWKEQNQRAPDNLLPLLPEMSAPDFADMTQMAQANNPDLELRDVSEYFDWTPILDIRPYQDLQAQGMMEQWIPRTADQYDDAVISMENVIYELSSSNTGYDLPLDVTHDEIDEPFELVARKEKPLREVLGPEQLECPLISQSIELNLLSRGGVDPFDTMPGLRNARAQALMYHYNKVLVKSLLSIAVDPNDKWFGFAISDSALFHSTMLHSAAHNAMLSGNTDLADPVPLKWEAMRLVNDRLNDPQLSISDLTIGTVVALVLFENQSANIELSNIHMDGLRKMVNIRGGLQNLGLAGILRRKVLWADICNSMLSHSKPRFSLRQSLSPNSRISNSPDNSPSSVPSQSLNPDKQVTKIFASLRSLSQILSAPFSRSSIAIDDIYSVERRLTNLLPVKNPCNDEHDSAPSQPISSIIHSCALAGLIYVYLFLRDFPIRAPIFQVFVSRLSASLFFKCGEDEDIERIWCEDGKSEMLFWVLVLGALAAEGRGEREKFVKDLRRVVAELGVRTFIGFAGKIRDVAWIERRDDEVLKTLWIEVKEGDGWL